jgi:hypothetical protein
MLSRGILVSASRRMPIFFFYQIQYSETLFPLLLHRAPTPPGFHAKAGVYRHYIEASAFCFTEIRINLMKMNKDGSKKASRWIRPMSIDL